LKNLLKSGVKGILEASSVSQMEIDQVKINHDRIAVDKNPVFFHQFVPAKASV
jgi:hypothetical protein